MAETSRSMQLKNLAASLPGANAQVQQGLDEARKTQLVANIGQQAGPAGVNAAQQIGAQQQQAAGQIGLQGQQTVQNQATVVGQMGLEEQGRQQRQQGFDQQLQLSQQDTILGQKLNKIDSNLKNELLDKQLKFTKDRAGNQLFNTRQLMDYAALNARNKEELANYTQAAEQVYARKLQILQKASDEVTAALQRGYITEGKALDQESKKKLLLAKAAFDKKQQEAKNEYANTKARNTAIGSVVGTVIGAVAGSVVPGIGTAAGAMAGGAIGGGIGGMIPG